MYILLSVFICILILVFLIMILISPAKVKNDDLKPFIGRCYAHRGLHSKTIPENSKEAFQAALEKGYGIEFDVRLTKDKKVIVFHDGDLSRMCGIGKTVESLTYDELLCFRLGKTEATVPLFSDILSLVNGKQPLLIELKSCDNYKILCNEVINELNSYKGLFLIQSFDPRILREFKRLQPAYISGQLACKLSKNTQTPLRRFMLSNLFTNIISLPHFISYRYEDTGNIFFKTATTFLNGYSAIWTIRDKKAYDTAVKAQTEMIIFEDFTPEPFINYDI